MRYPEAELWFAELCVCELDYYWILISSKSLQMYDFTLGSSWTVTNVDEWYFGERRNSILHPISETKTWLIIIFGKVVEARMQHWYATQQLLQKQ